MDFTYLKQFMDHLVEAERVRGNVIEVYYKGKKVFHNASGYNDLEEQKIMTGDEIFNIYS